MTTLASHFSENELQPILNGIRTFIRLTGLISDDFQYRWFADEVDAVGALKSIVTRFQLTERMLGKSKYQGQAFDAPRQVRADLEGLLLTGHTEMTTIANRKRNSPLFYLIIEPTITLFAKFDHESILAIIEASIADLIEIFNQCDAYGTYDDALVAQFQTRSIIREREEAAKLVKMSHRRSRKKDVMLESVMDAQNEMEESEETAEV